MSGKETHQRSLDLLRSLTPRSVIVKGRELAAAGRYRSAMARTMTCEDAMRDLRARCEGLFEVICIGIEQAFEHQSEGGH